MASIETGGAVTLINVDLAVIAGEADRAVTHVPACLVLARTSVHAGVGEALVYFQLTAGPCGRKTAKTSHAPAITARQNAGL